MTVGWISFFFKGTVLCITFTWMPLMWLESLCLWGMFKKPFAFVSGTSFCILTWSLWIKLHIYACYFSLLRLFWSDCLFILKYTQHRWGRELSACLFRTGSWQMHHGNVICNSVLSHMHYVSKSPVLNVIVCHDLHGIV